MNDYSMTKDMVDNSLNSGNSLALVLVILISLNIGVEIFRFIVRIVLLRKEKNNKRQLLIEEKRILVLEVLYQSLDKLTIIDRDETQLMLDSIKEINHYITHNKIYIAKTYLKCTNEILDYFKNLLVDYRQKSIEKESALFERFCHEFNK